MHEDFLHFIFRNRLWLQGTEVLVDGGNFEIIDVGKYNTDSGPDFFGAKIKIDGVVWCGNIELHVNSSDWYKHHHDKDEAYDNVVLHVVYNYDSPVILHNKRVLPTWEITFPQVLYNRYADFKNSEREIACTDYIDLVDSFLLSMWMEKMAVERLEDKSEYLETLQTLNKGNWAETLYVALARNFGYNTNSMPFELVAKQTPLNILLKNADNLFVIEAILFGQAGFLCEKPESDYQKRLSAEYEYQRQKYNLNSIGKSLWKNARMRPSNFPQVRIAQFAAIMQSFQDLVTMIFEDKFSVDFFSDVKVSDYWQAHYSLNEDSFIKGGASIGKSAINIIMINTVIPFAFYYGKMMNPDFNVENIIDKMRMLPSEDNRDTRTFACTKIKNGNAFCSQAMINLKRNYCDLRKCLSCDIGRCIMKELNKL